MKIALCDDEKKYLDEIETGVKAILKEQNISAEFDLFSDSKDIYSCNNFL